MKLLKSLRRYLGRVSELQNRGEDSRVYPHEFRSRKIGDQFTPLENPAAWIGNEDNFLVGAKYGVRCPLRSPSR